MAVQLSDAVRNARLDSLETAVGASAKLQIRTLTQPANCAAADVGALLCEIALPSDWMQAASGGTKAKSVAAWTATATGTGTAGHFRIKDSAGTTTHLQGDITDDMTLDNTSIASGQTVTVNSFTLTDANA